MISLTILGRLNETRVVLDIRLKLFLQAGSVDSNDSLSGCQFSPSETCFSDRKMNAIRAFHEWLPIRQVESDDKLRIWRNFQIGELADLTMLDTSTLNIFYQ